MEDAAERPTTYLESFELPLYEYEDTSEDELRAHYRPAIPNPFAIHDQLLPRYLNCVAAEKWVERAAKYLDPTSVCAQELEKRYLGSSSSSDLSWATEVHLEIAPQLLSPPVRAIRTLLQHNVLMTRPDGTRTLTLCRNYSTCPTDRVELAVRFRRRHYIKVDEIRSAIARS
ncbi:hypothetical protein NX059_012020 [Plenodomus lindquistii]|nr:hypothetical protein NX059_012020 [Plenodomus lindquistii]